MSIKCTQNTKRLGRNTAKRNREITNESAVNDGTIKTNVWELDPLKNLKWMRNDIMNTLGSIQSIKDNFTCVGNMVYKWIFVDRLRGLFCHVKMAFNLGSFLKKNAS